MDPQTLLVFFFFKTKAVVPLKTEKATLWKRSAKGTQLLTQIYLCIHYSNFSSEAGHHRPYLNTSDSSTCVISQVYTKNGSFSDRAPPSVPS